jgi:CHASE2 domain-containing sensor protein
MTNKETSRWALVQGLCVLWCLGMCVGFAITGQWMLLAAFSAAWIVGTGIAVGINEHRSKRQGK